MILHRQVLCGFMENDAEFGSQASGLIILSRIAAYSSRDFMPAINSATAF